MKIKTLGIASAAGGHHHGGRKAQASYFKHYLGTQPTHSFGIKCFYARRNYKLTRLFKQIHQTTQRWASQNQAFLVVEGDHSSAMGTWSGVLDSMPSNESLGLIWLDAHMDAHTFNTSPSGNIHGMPIAALLGTEDARLKQLYPGKRYLNPENLILIGLRSYEAEEQALLDSLGVKYYELSSIQAEGGLNSILEQSVQHLSERCSKIGLSIDLDVLDPRDAPGVATSVPKGIRGTSLINALKKALKKTQLCGLEISEYVPEKDPDGRTLKLLGRLVDTTYPSNENKFLGSSSSGRRSISLPN